MEEKYTQKRCSVCGASLKEGICPFCAADDSYIRRDIEEYRRIFVKSNDSLFNLALVLAERVELWKKTQLRPTEHYFKKIERLKGIELTSNSLKQAYYVGRIFPDLSEISKRKLSFSCYREIANSNIPGEDKQDFRLVAEKERMKRNEIRSLIKRKYKKGGSDEKTEVKEEIAFHTDNDFLKEVGKFLEKYSGIERGTIIILTYKIRRNKK